VVISLPDISGSQDHSFFGELDSKTLGKRALSTGWVPMRTTRLSVTGNICLNISSQNTLSAKYIFSMLLIQVHILISHPINA
jgi:hypothetical protein